MSNSSAVLAFDLGASSGRALLGEITSADHESPGMLKITEIHRFANIPVQMGQHLHWNFPMLLQEVKHGIRKAFQAGYQPVSYGIDSWGVDYGLIDRNGSSSEFLIITGICGRKAWWRKPASRSGENVCFKKADCNSCRLTRSSS